MDITVALGGGGVKGNAHIGVLRVLEREGFRIRAIAGTSAGGLWGSFYAAGYSLDLIQSRMGSTDFASLYTRRPGDGPAMMGLAGVCSLLQEALGTLTFEDLMVPFAVTAVDMETAQPVILNCGNVAEAIQATIAVPGIFPPKLWEGRLLIDGGVMDPVPVALARSMAPHLPVAAVVLSPPMAEWVKPPQPRLLNSLPFLSTYLSRLRVAQAFNIFLRSVDIGGALLTELRLQVDQPEVIIRPAVRHIGLLDTIDVAEVVRLGEEATEMALPALRRAAGWQAGVRRKIKRIW
jgi:NTE family protein